MRYRKKTELVDAVQWNGDPYSHLAVGVREIRDPGPGSPLRMEYYIRAGARELPLTAGDWIVHTPAGYEVLSPAEFAAAYEPAGAS